MEERDTASIIIDHSGPPPDMYDVQVREMSIIEETRHCRDSGQISISVEDPQLFFRIRSFFFLAGQKAFVKPMYGINVKPLTSVVDVC